MGASNNTLMQATKGINSIPHFLLHGGEFFLTYNMGHTDDQTPSTPSLENALAHVEKWFHVRNVQH